jgi:Domain of unknown function (DUF932)
VAAGFKSERWPDLSRNGGRLQIGTPAGFMSEYPAGLNRNPHARGNPLGLRLECFNSVDGSSRLVILFGWLRFVCTNGLVTKYDVAQGMSFVASQRKNAEERVTWQDDIPRLLERLAASSAAGAG